jgi:hypothetical protein
VGIDEIENVSRATLAIVESLRTGDPARVEIGASTKV